MFLRYLDQQNKRETRDQDKYVNMTKIERITKNALKYASGSSPSTHTLNLRQPLPKSFPSLNNEKIMHYI